MLGALSVILLVQCSQFGMQVLQHGIQHESIDFQCAELVGITASTT